MILERTTIEQLARMLAPHMDKPAWPGLTDAATKARARRWAKRLGIWERLDRELAPKPIPVIARSAYRDFRRTGRRTLGQEAYDQRLTATTDAALALWLGHPRAHLDYLQDLLWAWCETTTWIWPAHEGRQVDLGCSHIGRALAEIVWMLGDTLEDEVVERVRAEVERRILDRVCDWRHPDGWWTVPMNWNHVCNANVIMAALYLIRDPRVLAAYIHPLCQRLDYAIQGFADDGGCLEGEKYWHYGFGHFAFAALALHHRTGGELNLMSGEKVERICRFPLAAHIEGPFFATFADCSHGYILPEVALAINQLVRLPELYEMTEHHPDGRLAVCYWRDLALYRGERATGKADLRDYFLPDLGMAKLRAGGATLAALAGRNDLPHNHNDIGSFIYHRNGRLVLTDPGAPVYTAKTFGPRRYEILFCRSLGHSVPIVNGREQPAGSRFYGTISVEGLGGRGEKIAVIDMTHAYDDPTLERLERRLALSPQGALTITDSFTFRRKPRALEEGFVTYEPVRVAGGGRSVVIGKGRGAARLRCQGCEGAFAARRFVEESREGRHEGILTRITFTPTALSRRLTLTFSVA